MGEGASILPDEHRVLADAARWYAVLSSGAATPRDRSGWQAWLEDCAAHRQAWQRVEAVNAHFDEALPDPAARQLGAVSLEAAAQGRRSRRNMLKLAVVGGSASLLGMAAWQSPPARRWLAAWRADHVTPVGGMTQQVLADGTSLWLNTDTAVRVDYGPAWRRLVLLRGEIAIVTASDPSRPFLVETDEGRMQPLGTRFNVHSADHVTTLAVFEGAVQAHFKGGAPEGYRVDAGMQMRGGPAVAPLTPEPLQAGAGAWTRGILQVEEARLADVLAELGRYRPGRLDCGGAVADIRVSGTFPLRDTDRALSLLAQALPLRVSQPLPWWTRVSAR
ncbi:Fe2+-dicitrate sensor, membrane component [plant metagenome]|uniref:Fe2+-dicitrate sensor, membrane component n=1 Tax=plant metagenome TaxID=1297885 RepID=A0A484UY10_9ZZZZ